MKIKYLVSPKNIPDDGSDHIINNLAANLISSPDDQILVFPDVHYKKGSNVTNGLLTASDTYIYPSMLGVANCGYTWGKLRSENYITNEEVSSAFQQLAASLYEYKLPAPIPNDELWAEFKSELKKSWEDGEGSLVFNHLKIKSFDSLLIHFQKYFPKDILKSAAFSLGTLGGGNHFFEAHEVIGNTSMSFQKGEKIFILHSDSVSVGSKVYLLFSNLSDLRGISGVRGFAVRLVNRYRQMKYFINHAEFSFSYLKDLYCLLIDPNPMRAIDFRSKLGKLLLMNFYFASIFGEMNRRRIVGHLSEIIGDRDDLDVVILGSDSHDSISIETNGYKEEVVQRNGVQKLKPNGLFILPGALGTYSYVLKGRSGIENYYSVNHGVGRVHDKHLARDMFENPQTDNDILTLEIFRLSNSSLSEQHPKAFKSVDDIIADMEGFELADKIALLKPICSIKA